MNELFKIQAEQVKDQSMSNRARRIVYDSQENLSDDELARIASNNEKVGWLIFLPTLPKEDELLKVVSELPEIIKGKEEISQGVRLRAVIYKLWEKQGKKGNSELYYNATMENIITKFKEKLV